MSSQLPAEKIKHYANNGYLSPMRVISVDEAERLLHRFEEIERREGGRLSDATREKPHLLVPWLADLVRHPTIVGAVASILGPDVLCWSSTFFVKLAKDPAFVSWHQDSTYWGLSKPDVVTAWLAFTPSTQESGCLRVIPGSHKHQQLPHRSTGAADNLLSRTQEIEVEVDESEAVNLVLQPGEISLHHVMLIHGSEPNQADHPRIGLAIRYIAADVQQLKPPDSATLVAGKNHSNFELEPAPKADFHPDAVAYHDRIRAMRKQVQAVVASAQGQG